MKKIKIPCVDTKLVDITELVANDYNPNSVPRDKMKLLEQSIIDNGFCFPVVTIYDHDLEKYVIIDGFHRYSTAINLKMKKIPIVILDHDISQRMTATMQFNKARGVHSVDLDADVIKALIQQGKDEEEIAKHLGIDIETIHRYKSLTGILDLFKNNDYSKSWEIESGINDKTP